MDPKRATPRHIIIKIPKVKDKQKLKSSKRKTDSYLQRSFHKTLSSVLKRNFAGKKGLIRSIQNDEKQRLTTWITLSSQAVI